MPLHPVTLTLALIVLALGWSYGRLTKRFGMFRTSLAVILGLYGYMVFLSNGYFGLRIFLLGVLLNHIPLLIRIALWARSLGDWWFALRYRRSFEDIRAQERMDTDAAAAKRRAYHQAGQTNTQQDAWRNQAKAAREAKKQKSSQSSSGTNSKPNPGASRSSSRKTGGRQKTYRASSQSKGSSSRHNSQNTKSRTQSTQSKQRTTSRASSTPAPSPTRAAFQTLGLDPSGRYSAKDLKLAFRTAAKKAHPDLGGNTQRFMAVQAAYQLLIKGVTT